MLNLARLSLMDKKPRNRDKEAKDQYNKEYYQKNKQRLKELRDKEAQKKYAKEYYSKNKKVVLETAKDKYRKRIKA